MRITLIRHAETEQNFLDICQGMQNNSLCDDGRRRCTRLKNKLKDTHYDYCYMSPLLRAVETSIILIGDRVETIPDKRLIERGLGEYQGMPRKFYDADKYWDLDTNCSDRGVECINDLLDRCRDFLDYIKKKHKGQNIMVVSHGSVIRALRYLILDNDKKTLDMIISNLYCEDFDIKE